ncbi:beta-fructosidase [Holotrichia oblita]|nr:beta-fructosidase [Holotrichia oblita]
MVNEHGLEKANQYIGKNKSKIDNKYRHQFHFMAQVGWINDPNGFSFYQGEYHLFYQYYPYGTTHGPMHWGHAKSKDLIMWEHLPVALAPCDAIDEKGCFSGTAIEIDGEHILMYTGVVQDEANGIRQRQCIAKGDGVIYSKTPNHVITEDSLPDSIAKSDFRDPKIFKHDEMFYCILGTKSITQQGCLVLYESTNIYDWKFKNILNMSREVNGGVYECPDYFTLDEKDIFLISPQYKKPQGYRYHNIFSCVYKIGKIDFETGLFDLEKEEEIDSGFDFYAPQTLLDDRGRRIMIAWMQMWSRSMPSNIEKHNWAGAMTIPREIMLVGDKLYQYPVSEFKAYRDKEFVLELDFNGEFSHNELMGKHIDVEIEATYEEDCLFGIKLFQGKEAETIFTFDTKNKVVIFDRSNSGFKITGDKYEISNSGIRTVAITCDKTIKARFILDNTSVEAFFNDGEKAMTGNIYSGEQDNGISIFSDKQIHISIHQYQLK